MAKPYNPKEIEKKWQQYWDKKGLHKAEDFSDKPKAYVLDMFPYPSGSGLHVGHPLGYIATDVLSRYLRMNGKNVLHPMGWDAFGLPAENYAIKNKIHPRVAVEENIKRFKEQLALFGFSYDWSREINTTDPKYYKWTQWIFLQLFKAGLAYEDDIAINFCLDCKTGLANEEVKDGRCERCGAIVEKRKMRQWVLKITEYADRLLEDLDDLDWTDQLKEMQRNWIGRSEGAEVTFKIKSKNAKSKKFILLHGLSGAPNQVFHPWLKEELEKLGHEVFVPALPNPKEPNIDEQVQFLLDNFEFDERTVVVTHSLGGVAAMKLLPRLKQPIAKLVMVAPPVRAEDRWLDGKSRPEVKVCSDWQFDYAAIKEHAEEIIVLRDLNDDVVPSEHPQKIAEALGAELQEVEAREGHFDAPQEHTVLAAIQSSVRVYTTRPDTLFGATYVVFAPEHDLVQELLNNEERITNTEEVAKYVAAAIGKSDLERQENKEKTGVRIEGISAVNPVNGEELPVFVADYVLMQYGTGAIMAVPAHDERDFEFAKKFGLPITQVISPDGKVSGELSEAMSGEGTLVNSGDFTGMKAEEARKKITTNLAEKGAGTPKVNYKLRDWIFSRQRYWGEPIPIIHCEKCGLVPVPEEELPLLLPEVESYEPTGTGESPLATIDEWVNTKCPKCNGKAKRETNTMPQWAGSCWYYLRYIDPDNEDALVDPKKEKYWMPIDLYLGGAEHAVLHLLYARFWHKVLFDGGHVSTSEPFQKLFNQGMILGEDHQKMSKSRGNVVSPDDVIDQYGADSFRLYEMFMGPLEQEKPWDTKGIIGLWRFLKRVWVLSQGEFSEKEYEATLHRLIKKVTNDISTFNNNTAIAAMMEFINERTKDGGLTRKDMETLTLLLAPLTPHIAEEIWQEVLKKEGSVHLQTWPKFDDKLTEEDTVTYAVQVNGKMRGTINIQKGSLEARVVESAKTLENVKRAIGKSEIKKTIFIPDRIVNFITG